MFLTSGDTPLCQVLRVVREMEGFVSICSQDYFPVIIHNRNTRKVVFSNGVR